MSEKFEHREIWLGKKLIKIIGESGILEGRRPRTTKRTGRAFDYAKRHFTGAVKTLPSSRPARAKR